MRSWDFKPADYELMPGDLHRIAALADSQYNHVYKWYTGIYKGKPANEDLLMAAMLVVVTERDKLFDLMEEAKERLESIRKQLPNNQKELS
ncbi:MAG: hypothetical protein R2828_29460 [Saprospiraceae bacterium]